MNVGSYNYITWMLAFHVHPSFLDGWINSQKIHLVCCSDQRHGRGEHIQVAAKESQHEYGYYLFTPDAGESSAAVQEQLGSVLRSLPPGVAAAAAAEARRISGANL